MWALWKLSDDMGLELEDGDIAGYVEKIGGGAPTKQAIAKYRVQFECDPDWYPGKSTVEAQKRGPKPVFTKKQNMTVETISRCVFP